MALCIAAVMRVGLLGCTAGSATPSATLGAASAGYGGPRYGCTGWGAGAGAGAGGAGSFDPGGRTKGMPAPSQSRASVISHTSAHPDPAPGPLRLAIMRTFVFALAALLALQVHLSADG